MTEPPLDIDAIRKRHALGPRGWPVYCADCEGKNPCVVRLCDEVERLRGMAYKRAGQWMASAGQREAPSVSEGGKE